MSTNLPVTTSDDGFNDAAGDRLIRGELIRFTDGSWNTKEGTALSPDLQLLVVGLTKAIQRWQAKMPIVTIVAKPGERFPDVDDLNAAVPEDQWEVGLSGKRPPWIMSNVIYFIDPTDASAFTYLGSTAGGRIATERLAEKTNRMRLLRGARVLPLVTLDSRPMKTRYGVKPRPEFTVIDWRDFSATTQALPAPEQKALGKPVLPVSVVEELNDSINF
jgi:hypothetical protein